MPYFLKLLSQYSIILLGCALPLSPASAETDFPSEPILPDWLLENTMARGFWGAQNMILENGNLYISSPSGMPKTLPGLKIKNMDMKNGTISDDWPDTMDKQGMYIGGTSSEMNTGLRFFLCRDCTLTDKTSGESVRHNGLVFGKRDFTLTDLYSIPHPMHKSRETYIFGDEKTLKLLPVPGGEAVYTHLDYLKKLDYGDYLNMPVKTILRDKAAANDPKAQFLYAMYWFVNAIYDKSGRGNDLFASLLKQADKSNPDVLVFLSEILLAANDEATKYYQQAKAKRPAASALLAELLWKQQPQRDMETICQLYEESAVVGVPNAQFMYGQCLYYGDGGITADQKLGEAYIALSAANGFLEGFQKMNTCGAKVPEIKNGSLVFESCLGK